MRLPTFMLLALSAAAGLGSGCASQAQWDRWTSHSSHFASGEHLRFSVMNESPTPAPRVTRGDLRQAKTQSWWGDRVVVRPGQLARD